MNKKLIMILLLSCALPILAQQSTTPTDQTKTTDHSMSKKEHDKMMQGNSNLPAQDRSFVMKAAEGGQMEVQMAQTAVSKATNPEVKQFAQRLLDDHSKANEELKALATAKSVTISTETSPKTQKMITEMEKYSSEQFDREYMKDMVKDHQKDIALFEREARTGRDAEVKSWAEKTLPTLREHLKMARDISGKMGTTGTSTSKKDGQGMKNTAKMPNNK